MTKIVTDFGEEHVQELLNDGLTNCMLESEVEAQKVMNGIKWLCAQPEKERERWEGAISDSLKLSKRDRDRWKRLTMHQGQVELGLFRRGETINSETNEKEDAKWAFHYRPQLRALLDLKGVSWEEGRHFLDASDRLHQICTEFCFKVSKKLGIRLVRPYGVLRTILYDPTTTIGVSSAADHWDRSGISLQMGDNASGFCVAENDDYGPGRPKMRILPRVINNRIYLFVSAKAAMQDPERFKPKWHGVWATEIDISRVAIVYFYHTTSEDLWPGFRSKSRDPLARIIREARASRLVLP